MERIIWIRESDFHAIVRSANLAGLLLDQEHPRDLDGDPFPREQAEETYAAGVDGAMGARWVPEGLETLRHLLAYHD